MSEAIQITDLSYPVVSIESEDNNGVSITRIEARRNALANTAISSEVELDLYEIYIAEAKKYPLLNKEEEINLAKIIESGKEALDKINSDTELSDYEKLELERKVHEGSQAHETFTRANLLLVVHIAKKYKNQNSSLMDLIQEGNIGMMHAIDKFDWRKGFKFSTYATWWIKQAITRVISTKGTNIHLPLHAKEQVNQYDRLLGQASINNKPLTDEDICSYMSVTLEELNEIKLNRIKTLTLSLDSAGPGGEDDFEPSIMDKVMDSNTSYFDDELVTDLFVSEQFVRVMNILTPGIETEVIKMRYGLGGYKPLTLSIIAERLGTNRGRIKQIERNAFQKIRLRLEEQ